MAAALDRELHFRGPRHAISAWRVELLRIRELYTASACSVGERFGVEEPKATLAGVSQAQIVQLFFGPERIPGEV